MILQKHRQNLKKSPALGELQLQLHRFSNHQFNYPFFESSRRNLGLNHMDSYTGFGDVYLPSPFYSTHDQSNKFGQLFGIPEYHPPPLPDSIVSWTDSMQKQQEGGEYPLLQDVIMNNPVDVDHEHLGFQSSSMEDQINNGVLSAVGKIMNGAHHDQTTDDCNDFIGVPIADNSINTADSYDINILSVQDFDQFDV